MNTVLVMVAVFITVVAWWRPMVAISALVLMWPAYLVRTTMLGVPTTLLELALYGACLGVAVAVSTGRWSRTKIQLPALTWALIGLWSLSWVVATALSPDHRASFGALKAWWFDPLLFASLVILVVRSTAEHMMLLRSLVVSATVVAAAGLYQLVFVRDTLQEGRLSSFFTPVANYAAMYLAPLFVLGLALVVFRLLPRAWWLFIGTIALALAATMSYGGWLAAAVGGAIIWCFSPSSKQKTWLGILAVLVGIVGLSVLSTTKSFSQHFDPGRSSGSVRAQIWYTSWVLIQKHPLVGIGPNAFEAAYQDQLPRLYADRLEWAVAQPHNLYLALWLETGLLGLLTFLTATTLNYRALIRRIHSPEHRPVIIAVLAAMSAILVHGLVDTPLFKNDLALMFITLLVLPWLGGTKVVDNRP